MVWMNADGLEQTRKLLCEALVRCSSETSSSACLQDENSASVPADADSFHAVGELALFQGRLPEAAESFLAAWECAKQTNQFELRWRSCFGAARCYFALQQSALGRHFQQLGRNAFFSSADERMSARVPGEVLFSLLKEQLIASLAPTGPITPCVAQLLSIRKEAESRDFRGCVEEALAQADAPSRRKQWLRESLNSYLFAGNLYAAMLVAEPLAVCCLREGEWDVGGEVIEQAAQLASLLNQSARCRRYRSFSARLRHAMTGLEVRTVQTATSRRVLSCSEIWN